MRVFIGFFPSKEVKDHLYEVQKLFKGNLAKINFVSKKNLHVTYKFLGVVSEEKLDEIKNVLENLKFESLKIKLNGLGVFPYKDKLKVLWVGLEPEKKIIGLQKKVDSEFLGLGFSEDQKFSAHLTLGRIKLVKKKKEFVKRLEEIKVENLSFNMDEICLVQSILSKDGPKYKVLERYKSEVLSKGV